MLRFHLAIQLLELRDRVPWAPLLTSMQDCIQFVSELGWVEHRIRNLWPTGHSPGSLTILLVHLLAQDLDLLLHLDPQFQLIEFRVRCWSRIGQVTEGQFSCEIGMQCTEG